ncbi:MAG: CinA family protein, partial [Clostridia bacterium]|nr:CinA family protein [Clostridia bacterium]
TEFGVVSPQTAEEMAKGIREYSGADVGVAVTGFAGPGGGTDQYPVGTVFMGIASARGVRHVHLRLKGDRDRVRSLTVNHALAQLLEEL